MTINYSGVILVCILGKKLIKSLYINVLKINNKNKNLTKFLYIFP
ncbi:hypothetical protein J672_0748 [Acinetobacter sp. 883425]|nr:hypothetical protein J536_0097 [Acinetobacter sp. 809848]EXS17526.1 hypothetical protein J672_0748 [Acinetobacter sp. 883425]